MPQPFSKIRLPRRLLVTRTDRLGDVVLSTPVLKSLRVAFPEARITACVSAETREIVEGNPQAVSIRNPDNGKARRELGWAPRLGLREGLATLTKR